MASEHVAPLTHVRIATDNFGTIEPFNWQALPQLGRKHGREREMEREVASTVNWRKNRSKWFPVEIHFKFGWFFVLNISLQLIEFLFCYEIDFNLFATDLWGIFVAHNVLIIFLKYVRLFILFRQRRMMNEFGLRLTCFRISSIFYVDQPLKVRGDSRTSMLFRQLG